MSTQKVVVVGVDGSAGSEAALRYAVTEAIWRDATLRVVTADEALERWMAYGLAMVVDPTQLRAKVLADTQRMVDEVMAGCPHPPQVVIQIRPATPQRALVEASEDAELLVVGRRGRGSVTSALLGSVSLACVLHATVPVTVVQARTEPAQPVSGLARSSSRH